MKKINIMLFVMISLVIILLNISIVPCTFSKDIGEAIKILPESTDFVIEFSSTKECYDYLSITEKSFWGQPIEDISEIKERLGFNPFDLKEFNNNEIDITKPFGIAISDIKIAENSNVEGSSDTPNMNIILFLPVKDVDKAVAKIQDLIEEENPDAHFNKNGDMWSWYFDMDSSEPEDLEAESETKSETESETKFETKSKTESETESKTKAESETETESKTELDTKLGNAQSKASQAIPQALLIPSYMVSKNGYLFIGGNPLTDAKEFFQKLAKNEKKLAQTPEFINVIDKTDLSRQIFLYANLGRIFKSNPLMMQYLKTTQSIKDYQGMGVSVDLKSPDLKADFVLNIIEKSEIFNLFKGISAKRDLILGLKENPLMLMGVVENFQAYWQMMQTTVDKETLNSIQKQFVNIKNDYNIDVEKDIIQNFGYNISGGMYDAISINMANINALASVELKEISKMKAVIEKIIPKLSPNQQSMINKIQINGSDVYMVNAGPLQVYAGFVGNEMVITLGKAMFEKTMTADISNGFMSSLKDNNLKISLQKDTSIFFLDVGEAMYALKNFLPMLAYSNPDAQIMMMPAFQQIMKPFDYISAFCRIDGNAMFGEFVFKTNFNKPFFKGVKDITDQIQSLKNTTNLQKPLKSNKKN